jgi:hypothetical protein
LDHFTKEIIHNELRAVTSSAPPDPTNWVFSVENNLALMAETRGSERVQPEEWVKRGPDEMQATMRAVSAS